MRKTSRTFTALSVALAAACTKADAPPAVDAKAHADGLYLAATNAYQTGDFAKAEELFTQVKSLAPDDARLPMALGELYLSQGKLGAALAQFEAALSANPDRVTALSRAGFILSVKGQRQEARALLTRALETSADDEVALEALAGIEFAEGQLDAGIGLQQRAAALSRTEDRPGMWLISAKALMSVERLTEAEALLSQAPDAGAASVETWTTLGELRARLGRFHDAALSFADAARADGKDTGLWALAAEAHLRAQEPQDAELAFRNALKVADNTVAHVGLARLCLARKDRACVDAELGLAVAAATGSDPREVTELAFLLDAVGKPKEAVALLSTLAAEPDRQSDVALLKDLAKFAARARDTAVIKSTCQRLKAADAGLKRCP